MHQSEQYPNGKLSDDDEGASQMAVYNKQGRVLIRFPAPTNWIGMNTDQAFAFAAALVKHARRIVDNIPDDTPP
jgi:hypothetical protein